MGQAWIDQVETLLNEERMSEATVERWEAGFYPGHDVFVLTYKGRSVPMVVLEDSGCRQVMPVTSARHVALCNEHFSLTINGDTVFEYLLFLHDALGARSDSPVKLVPNTWRVFETEDQSFMCCGEASQRSARCEIAIMIDSTGAWKFIGQTNHRTVS